MVVNQPHAALRSVASETPNICHRGRHPQEGSRPVAVVHDEKLLAIRPAASDCVIPRHAGKLARQRLTSDDLAGAAWHPAGLERLTAGLHPSKLTAPSAASDLPLLHIDEPPADSAVPCQAVERRECRASDK